MMSQFKEVICKCWWRILLWIEMENSGVSREYMASAGIISLNHILNLSEAQLPEATKTSRCLLMVKLNEQPQWKVSESNVYALLRKAATGSLDGFTHGILAYERQFLLFQVHRSGEIHYLMGSDGVPQDLRQLLNDAKIREEFEGYMNDIVVSAQQHRVSSRVQDTSTPITQAVLVIRTATRYNARTNRTVLLTQMCQIVPDQWLVRPIET